MDFLQLKQIEFDNYCEEWYESVFNDNDSFLNSPILSNLENIQKANIYFKENKKMTIQMIALKTRNIELFEHFKYLEYNIFEDLDFLNPIKNNFFMMLNHDSKLYLNLIFNYEQNKKWFKYIDYLRFHIFNNHFDEFNINQINQFGDNFLSLNIKNHDFIFFKNQYLKTLFEKIKNNKLNIEHQDFEGNNIIHLIIKYCNFLQESSDDFIDFILKLNKTHMFEVPNKDNMTPLMFIFKYNKFKFFKDFIFSNLHNLDIFNIDQIDKFGNNCLYYLSKNNYYTKNYINIINTIFRNLKNIHIVNCQNEALFVKLLTINDYTLKHHLISTLVERIKNNNDFSIFEYIDTKNNMNALMYFFIFIQNTNYQLSEELIMDILNYPKNNFYLKTNDGFNIFNITFNRFTDNVIDYILKKLNYDIELYKDIKPFMEKISIDFYYADSIINYYCQSNTFNNTFLTINNNLKINYRYQTKEMLKNNDTFLTNFKNNDFIKIILKNSKDDEEFLSHTNNYGTNFFKKVIESNNDDLTSYIIELKIKIPQKLFEIKDNESTLLMSALDNNNVDMACYLLTGNFINIEEMKKYISTIIDFKISRYNQIVKTIKKSAFTQMLLCKSIYGKNKKNNKFDKSIILNNIVKINLIDFRQNLKLFKYSYLNDKDSHKNTILYDNYDSINTAYSLILNIYKKYVIDDLKKKNIDINLQIPDELFEHQYQHVFDI